MTPQLVIGVDPGATTGICAVLFREQRAVLPPVVAQIRGARTVVPYVIDLVDAHAGVAGVTLAVEAFVTSTRAARSAHAFAGRATRELIGALSDLTERTAVEFVSRPAATVKPWATDRVLEAAGLLGGTADMRHARDAARHALYAAVSAGYARHPLSRHQGALR